MMHHFITDALFIMLSPYTSIICCVNFDRMKLFYIPKVYYITNLTLHGILILLHVLKLYKKIKQMSAMPHCLAETELVEGKLRDGSSHSGGQPGFSAKVKCSLLLDDHINFVFSYTRHYNQVRQSEMNYAAYFRT